MSGCAATPTSFVEYDTAVISGTAYTAQPVTWIFNEEFGFTAQQYTYSALPATLLTPGEEVTLVKHLSLLELNTNESCIHTIQHRFRFSSHRARHLRLHCEVTWLIVSLTIPYDVQTPISIATTAHVGSVTPTQTSSTPSVAIVTATAGALTSQNSSTPIGPIVGGIVGGVIVLGAIMAIAVFYLKKRQKYTPPINRASTVQPAGYRDEPPPPAEEAPPYTSPTKSINAEVAFEQAQYNSGFQPAHQEVYDSEPSGRLRYDN